MYSLYYLAFLRELVGTRKFCIGFHNDLTLNISNTVPEAVASFVEDEVQSLRPLEGILAKVTPANIQGRSILGCVFILFILFIVLICSCLFYELIS
jgi:hypothetical protein